MTENEIDDQKVVLIYNSNIKPGVIVQLTLSSRFKGPTSLKYILTSTFTGSPEIKRNMLHFNANDNKIGFMNDMIHTKFKAPWPARFESRYTGALESGGQVGRILQA